MEKDINIKCAGYRYKRYEASSINVCDKTVCLDGTKPWQDMLPGLTPVVAYVLRNQINDTHSYAHNDYKKAKYHYGGESMYWTQDSNDQIIEGQSTIEHNMLVQDVIKRKCHQQHIAYCIINDMAKVFTLGHPIRKNTIKYMVVNYEGTFVQVRTPARAIRIANLMKRYVYKGVYETKINNSLVKLLNLELKDDSKHSPFMNL